MKCPEAGCDYQGFSKSQWGQHYRFNHPGLKSPFAKAAETERYDTPAPCPDCSFVARSPHGLRIHQLRWCKKRSAAPATEVWDRQSRPDLAEAHSKGESAVTIPIGEETPTRRSLPPKEDGHNAETLSGLPWITYPATVDACNEALDRLAVALEGADRSIPFLCSVRAIVTELRKRLMAGKAAA